MWEATILIRVSGSYVSTWDRTRVGVRAGCPKRASTVMLLMASDGERVTQRPAFKLREWRVRSRDTDRGLPRGCRVTRPNQVPHCPSEKTPAVPPSLLVVVAAVISETSRRQDGRGTPGSPRLPTTEVSGVQVQPLCSWTVAGHDPGGSPTHRIHPLLSAQGVHEWCSSWARDLQRACPGASAAPTSSCSAARPQARRPRQRRSCPPSRLESAWASSEKRAHPGHSSASSRPRSAAEHER